MKPQPRKRGRKLSRLARSGPAAPELILWCDGLAEPTNPGIGCYGWIVKRSGQVIGSGFGHLEGRRTNNEAEIAALIAGLSWAAEHGLRAVEIRMDSKMVVKQVMGQWRCRAEHLWPLLMRARDLVDAVEGIVTWVPRERNVEADALSRHAYYERRTELGLALA